MGSSTWRAPSLADQERRLDVLKLEMAERVMSRPAVDVYDTGPPERAPTRPGESRLSALGPS